MLTYFISDFIKISGPDVLVGHAAALYVRVDRFAGRGSTRGHVDDRHGSRTVQACGRSLWQVVGKTVDC